ncbi:MAG: protein-glutamate O-methyltransferase CheR [Thiotrichaceae bacterium]|nr:protein-glutamate O-methyltransferase CheR [Thiotrichaceae bacterium]
MTAVVNKSVMLESIKDDEFVVFQQMIYEQIGISMSTKKKSLVEGRLAKRLRHYGFNDYAEYIALVQNKGNVAERQIVIDMLTTNETSFFREQRHFDFLASEVIPKSGHGSPYRIWSGASSSGEEAYSMAMLFADQYKSGRWEIVGTDISQQILAKARQALYPMRATEKISADYLNRFCLKGVREQDGMFLIDKKLTNNVTFNSLNLNGQWPSSMGMFDLILLRNVMIYFDQKTKQVLVEKILRHLRPGGYFMIGHSETLNGVSSAVKMIKPSIYLKP